MKKFVKDVKNTGLMLVGTVLGAAGILIAAPARVIESIGVALMEGGHKIIGATIEHPDPAKLMAEIADA